ncbi:hypothetical protein V6N11_019064 [Hibiscus sabdariffa]|uniref:Uncharacterized protein n=1 Tax=Hibiscus sabdariffa TaxID=183260 RepID=A0ABR2R1D6_9ROSI
MHHLSFNDFVRYDDQCDFDRLGSLFMSAIVAHIVGIFPPSLGDGCDHIAWSGTSSGAFSVSSAYEFLGMICGMLKTASHFANSGRLNRRRHGSHMVVVSWEHPPTDCFTLKTDVAVSSHLGNDFVGGAIRKFDGKWVVQSDCAHAIRLLQNSSPVGHSNPLVRAISSVHNHSWYTELLDVMSKLSFSQPYQLSLFVSALDKVRPLLASDSTGPSYRRYAQS